MGRVRKAPKTRSGSSKKSRNAAAGRKAKRRAAAPAPKARARSAARDADAPFGMAVLKPASLSASRLRALRPAFIPLVNAVGQRRGPKIIAVRRTDSPLAPTATGPATSGPALVARAASPSKPIGTTTAAPAVRLGRLPPRGGTPNGTGTPPRIRSVGLDAITVAPTAPRRPLSKERWPHLDARAARLGVALDADARAVVRAVAEGTSTLSTASRGRGHELAALAGAIELPQTVLVVGADAWALADLRERVERAGVRAMLLNDAKGASLHASVLDAIGSGVAKVVLTTPRWLARDPVLRALGRPGVGVVIILEAQGVSPLSAAFSPAHARLALHLERLGRPPACALAPGASAEICHDVTEALLPAAPRAIGGAAVAANVPLSALQCPREARRRALVDAAQRLPRPMLVFCASPQEVDAAYDTLRSLGMPTHRYHEEMRAGVRAAEQLEFSMPGEEGILVATSAFAPAGGAFEEDPEGVPLRYGRRTAKVDIRSVIRFDPPASLEQLVDELSLVARDGKGGHALVLHDPGDRPAVEARTDATRPSGEQIMLMARALETMSSDGAITTEALALAARSSRRAVEGLADLLDGMGLVTHRDGWLTRIAPESVVLRELRGLAERYATVRVLDTRRLGSVLELVSRGGCKTAALARTLGDTGARDCGACVACKGEELKFANAPSRQAPARRFSVQTVGDRNERAGTFHADERVASHSHLTAKLADFSR